MASAPPPDLSAVETGDETGLFLDVGAGLVEVAEITDLPSLPSGTQTTFETTHLKSGDYKEHKKNKRKDGDEVEITGNYVIDSDAEATLEAAEASRGAIRYQIHAPQGDDVFIFEGWALFMNLKRSNPAESRREFTITAKWVTAPTRTKQA
nr:hypothetical protein [uncultured organism]